MEHEYPIFQLEYALEEELADRGFGFRPYNDYDVYEHILDMAKRIEVLPAAVLARVCDIYETYPELYKEIMAHHIHQMAEFEVDSLLYGE